MTGKALSDACNLVPLRNFCVSAFQNFTGSAITQRRGVSRRPMASCQVLTVLPFWLCPKPWRTNACCSLPARDFFPSSMVAVPCQCLPMKIPLTKNTFGPTLRNRYFAKFDFLGLYSVRPVSKGFTFLVSVYTLLPRILYVNSASF